MLDIPTENSSPPISPSQNTNSNYGSDENNGERGIKIERGPAIDIARPKNKGGQKKEGFFNFKKNSQQAENEHKEEAIIEPGIEIEGSIERKTDTPLIFTLLAALLVFGFTGYLFYAKSIKAAEVEEKNLLISEVDEQLSAKDIQETEERVQNLSRGINDLKKFLTEQLLWTNLFSELSNQTLQAVTLSDFSVDGEGDIKVEGKTDTYSNVAKAMRALENWENVKGVELEGLSMEEEQEGEGENASQPYIKFGLTLKYDTQSLTLKENKKNEENSQLENNNIDNDNIDQTEELEVAE